MPLASLNHVQISIVSRRYCASEKQTKKNSSKNALEKCNKMGADTVDYRKFNSGSFNPDWRSQPAPINFYGLKFSLSLSSNWPSLNSSNFTGQYACTWPLWWLQKWQGLSWRHLKDSRCIQHMLSPTKSACIQPVLRRFSSNNDSSLWMITVLTLYFFLLLLFYFIFLDW